MMKTLLKTLAMFAALFIITNCSEEPSAPPFVEKYCPPPYDTLSDIDDPGVINHAYQKVSPDGEKLAYLLSEFELRVLNLKTGKVQNIDFREKLPPHIKYIAVSKALWCPYNSNRLLAQIVTRTDTVGDGKRYILGANLYIVSLNDMSLTRVTPEIVGPAGGILGNFVVWTWLPGSSESNDMLQLSFQLKSNLPAQQKIYKYQTQEMTDPIYKSPVISKDGLYSVYRLINPQPNEQGRYQYLINDVELKLKDQAIMTRWYSSFSPDGRKLALSVQISAVEDGRNIPYYLQRFSEVWIIDVEKFLREKPDTAIYPDKIINYRKAFCMYNYEAGYAEYITNDRLAVSMFHTVNDGYGFLYEITEDGRMVRQLTFVP